jgi:hypothetical protein
LRIRLREAALGADGHGTEDLRGSLSGGPGKDGRPEGDDQVGAPAESEVVPTGSSSFQSFFGAWLWERWRATLEPVGIAREAFIDVVAGYRRELWLWIVGDRGWEQMLSGLAGRVSRRLLVD